jgi:hypothetical protein
LVIALTKESRVADSNFLSGAQELRTASALGAPKFGFPFPNDGHARLLRRGALSCSEVSRDAFLFFTQLTP